MHCLVVQGAHHDLKESEACVGMWDFSALQHGGLGHLGFLEYYYDTDASIEYCHKYRKSLVFCLHLLK